MTMMTKAGMTIASAGGSKPSPYFTEEHEMFRAQLRRFIDTEIKPKAEAWETDGFVPRDVIARMGALGFLGIRYGNEHGGAEMDTLASVVLAEELGRSTFGGFAITVLVHTDMASPHLVNAGTPAQLRRWLPGIIKGEIVTAVAVSEPGAGSDVAAIKTTARRDGTDYVLDGSKIYITNGVLADLVFVAAKTDTAQKGSRGISIFAVERGAKGFSVGRKLDKMGWRSSDTAELHFDGVRVPAENRIGEENRGFYAVMQNFQNERVVLGAQALGEAQAALALTIDWVQTRKAFGATLWDKQTIRQRLAMLMAKVESARQFVYHTAWLDTQNVECVREVSMVKALCGELVNEVVYACQQFHGGMGYMTGTPIERMARDARVQSIGGGATEVMLEEVAKRIGF